MSDPTPVPLAERITTAFDVLGAVATAAAAALFVLGLAIPAGATLVAGVVLLAWSAFWQGAIPFKYLHPITHYRAKRAFKKADSTATVTETE